MQTAAATFPVDHLTGATVVRLMRAQRKTIAGLAAAMGITQRRVRQVRAQGVRGCHFVADWMEAIVGNPHAGWDVVARVYL